jgi:MscS family membrane protein
MLGITHIIILLNIFLQLELIKAIAAVRTIGVIVSILWFALSLISEFEEYWSNGTASTTSKLDKTTVSALSKILRITAFVISGLIILETLGFSISGMLAFGGVGGIAVSFASKDMLANFFGAFMIYLDKPFKVGDWIRVPEKDIEGYVEKIGLRCTVVRTMDKRPLYVPNSIFSVASIENPSRMSHRKINEEIALRHEDLHLIPDITEEVTKMLKEHPLIDKKQAIVVSLNSLAYASANIMVYAFTRAIETEDYYKVKHDIMLRIAAIIDKYEAKMTQASYVLQLPEEYNSNTLENKNQESKKSKKSKGSKKLAESDD